MHPAVLSHIARDREMISTSQVRCKPMVVPPVDWSTPSLGGFLVLRSFIIKDKPGTNLQVLYLFPRFNQETHVIFFKKKAFFL